MKVALVITVKNEERHIRSNLEYHHASGVDKVFLFMDDPEDHTFNMVVDLDYVEVIETVTDSAVYMAEYKYLTDLTSQHHTARQMMNYVYGINRAYNEGFDWVICCDADEVVVNMEPEGSIKTALKKINNDVDVIQMPVWEILQNNKGIYTDVFKEATLFKTKFNKYWYGHTLGKFIVKPYLNLKPINVHNILNQYKLGMNVNYINHPFRLLHYAMYDWKDYAKKAYNFKQQKEVWANGYPIPNKLKMLIDIVNDPDKNLDSLKRQYFDTIYIEESVEGIKEITKVKNILNE